MHRIGLFLACWILAALPAQAVPIVSVDLDPATSGAQDSLTVAVGESFSVDILLDTDGSDVGGFELDLAPGGVGGHPLIATGILVNALFGAGDTFGIPNTDITEQTLDNGFGEAAARAGKGVFGSLVNGNDLLLATVTFTASALGVLDLDLNDIQIFDASAQQLPATALDASVEVIASRAVGLPATLLLLAPLPSLLRSRPRRASSAHISEGRCSA